MIDTTGKTLQQVVAEVMDKLVEQGSRCTVTQGSNDFCQYSDGNGKHCAVGWLLPEDVAALEVYQDSSVSSLISHITNNQPAFMDEEWFKFLNSNRTAMMNLQSMHDSAVKNPPPFIISKLTYCINFFKEEHGIDPNTFKPWLDLFDIELDLYKTQS